MNPSNFSFNQKIASITTASQGINKKNAEPQFLKPNDDVVLVVFVSGGPIKLGTVQLQ